VWSGEVPSAVVLGIGVNVAPDALPPGEQLLFPGTTVETELEAPISRWDLLAEILQHLFTLRKTIGTPAFLTEWESNLAYINQPVRLDQGSSGSEVVGIMLGIDPDGSLRIRREDGKIALISAGDVRLRPASLTSSTSTGR
jgi:BirA family biotin operon repressor/biotin-[acetyl-CoA-carboxylase] ligase